MVSMANRLGDIRAENDHSMLDQAFLETADYRTILEADDKVVIVGRRGTGKSALTYKLSRTLLANSKSLVISLAPEEDQVIGMRPILQKFGGDYALIRAAVRISWEALLLLEVLNKLCKHYRFDKSTAESNELRALVAELFSENQNAAYNLRFLLNRGIKGESPEHAIGELAKRLHLRELKEGLSTVSQKIGDDLVILIDRLDEGYVPDTAGIAYISGIIQGTLNVNSGFSNVRPIIFIRDNMYRAVASIDPDYTRNMEGSSLRLHWTEHQLLNLAAKRLRIALGVEQENDIRVWNHIAADDLQGRDGFRKCLHLTLFRPRDLLALLNQALFLAYREDRVKIIGRDLEATAKEISQTRLDDLIKEYSSIFPSLKIIVLAFYGVKAEFSAEEARKILEGVLKADTYEPVIQQDVAFFDTPNDAIRALYSVGFFGIADQITNSYSFCHDGRSPDLTVQSDARLLIHPCYQVALNLKASHLDADQSHEIHDDFEIQVESVSQEQRNRKIGQLISRLQGIQPGNEDAGEFAQWCLDAIRICFAGDLRNIEHHQGRCSGDRRDVIANNVADNGFWREVLNKHSARQVIFAVKNYEHLTAEDYKELSACLTGNYGKLGFVITRSENKEPDKERDLQWIREIYKNNDNRLIIVLSYKWLTAFLEKVRNPQKHDAIDKALRKVLRSYERIYL